MHIVLVLNGEMDFSFFHTFMEKKQADLYIAVDGGIRYFSEDFLPDLWIGDMDSYSALKETEKQKKVLSLPEEKILRYPCEKDETDSELALKKAISLGAEQITILAFRGKRMDHVYGNLSLLSYGLKHKSFIVLEDEYNKVRLSRSPVRISKDDFTYLSLFSYSEEVRGLTLRGLKYELTDFTLKKGMVQGISNEMTGEVADLSFNEGELLIIQSREEV